MNFEAVIMGIIMHGGNARSYAMQAMQEARVGNFDASLKLMEASDEALNEAHQIQTNLIQDEVRGESVEISLLMIHAQDHLMNAMTVRDLAVEIIEGYKK